MRYYKDLISELELHEKLRASFEVSLKYWLRQFDSTPKELRGQDYSMLDMPRGSRDDTTLDRIVYQINHFNNLIVEEDKQIQQLKECEEYIVERIKDSNNIYNKVAYLKYQRDEQGKKRYTLEQIAEMLVYGIDRIKQISSQV
jgi:hypothetical protein